MIQEKEQLISEIKELLVYNDGDTIEINPSFLEYFEIDELNSIKNSLLYKKSNFSEINSDYIDELYEKTKKDEL